MNNRKGNTIHKYIQVRLKFAVLIVAICISSYVLAADNTTDRVIRDNIKYQNHANRIEALDLQTGQVLWHTPIWSTTFLPFVNIDRPWSIVKSIDFSDGMLEVRDSGGNLIGLINAKTGKDKLHNSFLFWLKIHRVAFLVEIVFLAFILWAVCLIRQQPLGWKDLLRSLRNIWPPPSA